MQLERKKQGRPHKDKKLIKDSVFQVMVTGEVYKKITKVCKKEQITISSLLMVGINQKLAELEADSKTKTKVKEIETNI